LKTLTDKGSEIRYALSLTRMPFRAFFNKEKSQKPGKENI